MKTLTNARQPLGPITLSVLLAMSFVPCRAEEIRIAVASNFAATLDELEEPFVARHGHSFAVSAGSTGKLYAQIVNGAPFDILLAADVRRPQALEEDGQAVPGSRFTYARGRLVVWSVDPALRGNEQACEQLLRQEDGKIAIANPMIAPYGAAARSALQELGDWSRLSKRLVVGENVAQALHFVATGNAQFGLIAEAQLVQADLPAASCRWRVPSRLHMPIEQQAVLLVRARDSIPAQTFMDFLQSSDVRRRLVARGYEASDEE